MVDKNSLKHKYKMVLLDENGEVIPDRNEQIKLKRQNHTRQKKRKKYI